MEQTIDKVCKQVVSLHRVIDKERFIMKNESKRAERMGEVFINNYGNTFKIIEYKNAKNVTVEFKCGYITTATYSSCKKREVSCPYDKRYNGVACIGLKKDGTEPICYINGKPTKAYALWCAMINRVYNKKQLRHHPGYKKSKVCDRWLVFANFLEDLPNILNYELWLNSNVYELDKDLLQYGQEFKIYSPETCMFVPRNVNIHLPKQKKEKAPKPKKVIRLIHLETGMFMDFNNQQEVADKLGIGQPYVSRLIKKNKEYNGYKIEVLYI